MKRAVSFLLALLLLSLAGCGSSSSASSAPAAKAEAEAAQPSAPAEEPTPAPAELVTIEGNVITVRDDGTGEDSDGDGMKKTVILTNRNIAYTGECGPIDYEIQSIQIAKINVTGDAAQMLGLDSGKDAALVAIQLSVENTSDEDMTWYPNQSTIVTSDKEQVAANLLISDSVGGEFMGNVIKQGQIYFICKNTNAETLSHVRWRIDSPHDSKYNHFGEDIEIEFDFPKG